MSEIVKTMKLHIHVNETEAKSLDELTACYAQACTFISKYVFDHGFILNFPESVKLNASQSTKSLYF